MARFYCKSRNLISLFAIRPITVVAALCLFALSGFATAETLDDCADQTLVGQNFTFSFPGVGQASVVGDGTLRLHVRGDYTIAHPTSEYLTWDIEGHCSDVAAPAYGTVIQTYASDDVEWEQSFVISNSCLTAATSDSSVTISIDLSSVVHIYGPSFVCVELTYSTVCIPPEVPASPNPPDNTEGVSGDIELAWNYVFPLPCDLGNGGFEDSVFTPWTNITGPGDEYEPWTIATGAGRWFPGFPFEGSFFAQNGFDGDAGLFYDIYQEITIPADATSAILNWSERIQWDMANYGATLPREYRVTIQPAGGGSSLAVLHTMNLNPGTNGDTGYVPHSVDLLIASPGLAGQTVRINFHETIPETFTGPAQFDLDGIEFVCNGSVVQRAVLPGTAAEDNTIVPAPVQYDQLRQESLALQNELPDVQIGTEDIAVIKDGSPPPAVSQIVQVANVGGPDCGGYTFIDSDEPGGPSFDWIEIRGSGTNLNLSDDSWYFPITLPFSFDFYGTSHTRVAVGSNGTVHFVNRYMTLGNLCIPSSGSGIDEFIAVYWDDLHPIGSNNVYYAIVGSAPNRILVVQWDNVRHYGGSSSNGVTAQAQLFEGSNDVLLLYENPSSEAGSGGTVGIQRDSGCGLRYLCNQRNLQSNLAILFSRDSCSGQSTTYDVYFGLDPDNMELIADDICETSYDPTPEPGVMLEECTDYFWQVIVTSPCGSETGPIWRFKTGRQDGSPCNMPPDCSNAVPSVTEIWPPNHKWVNVEILGVTDPDGDDFVVIITGITQDEAVAGHGSGTSVPDGDGIGTSMARLRAERTGLGNGRTYEISFEATDIMGAMCNGAVQVCVPHSMGQSPHDSTPGRVCIDDGQLFESSALELLRADLNSDGVINQLDFAILSDYWLASYELEE